MKVVITSLKFMTLKKSVKWVLKNGIQFGVFEMISIKPSIEVLWMAFYKIGLKEVDSWGLLMMLGCSSPEYGKVTRRTQLLSKA